MYLILIMILSMNLGCNASDKNSEGPQIDRAPAQQTSPTQITTEDGRVFKLMDDKQSEHNNLKISSYQGEALNDYIVCVNFSGSPSPEQLLQFELKVAPERQVKQKLRKKDLLRFSIDKTNLQKAERFLKEYKFANGSQCIEIDKIKNSEKILGPGEEYFVRVLENKEGKVLAESFYQSPADLFIEDNLTLSADVEENLFTNTNNTHVQFERVHFKGELTLITNGLPLVLIAKEFRSEILNIVAHPSAAPRNTHGKGCGAIVLQFIEAKGSVGIINNGQLGGAVYRRSSGRDSWNYYAGGQGAGGDIVVSTNKELTLLKLETFGSTNGRVYPGMKSAVFIQEQFKKPFVNTNNGAGHKHYRNPKEHHGDPGDRHT